MEPTTGRSAYMSHGRTKTKHQRHANAALLNALSTPAGLLSLVTGGICHASSEARHPRPSVAAPQQQRSRMRASTVFATELPRSQQGGL